MKKLMNKKGFTLVELLAVIVILAVIILVAMNAVIPQMENARKNAFKTEVETFAKAAETYFANQALSNPSILTSGGCVTVETLKNGYVNKSDEKYVGQACIKSNKIYLALTSGAYDFNSIVTDLDSEELDGKITKVTTSSSTITESTVPTGYTTT